MGDLLVEKAEDSLIEEDGGLVSGLIFLLMAFFDDLLHPIHKSSTKVVQVCLTTEISLNDIIPEMVSLDGIGAQVRRRVSVYPDELDLLFADPVIFGGERVFVLPMLYFRET